MVTIFLKNLIKIARSAFKRMLKDPNAIINILMNISMSVGVEKCLINEYTNTFGSLPVGNFQDLCNRNRSVSKSRFYSIIEELT